MKYYNVYCLKSLIIIVLKIWLWVVNPYIFWSKHEKNYEHSGKRYSKSKKKWLRLASVYQIIWNTLVKHGFIEKNESQYFWEHIWNRIFQFNFVKCWCIQKRYAAQLLHWTDIHIQINRTFWWNSVPHDHSNAYLPNI